MKTTTHIRACSTCGGTGETAVTFGFHVRRVQPCGVCSGRGFTRLGVDDPISRAVEDLLSKPQARGMDPGILH